MEINFRARSEHTIDGMHGDLEMQVLYQTRNDIVTSTLVYPMAGVSVIFKDTDNSSEGLLQNDQVKEVSASEMEIIDQFFDSLKWDVVDQDPVSDMIPFGDLMKIVDFKENERWAYRGSLTQPPCSQYVFWNVMSKGLPI